MTETIIRKPHRARSLGRLSNLTVRAAGLASAALLSGCTGSDTGIDFGPNGPIPPASIGSVAMSGAPPVSAADLGSASPSLPPYETQPEPQYAAAAPLEDVQRAPVSSLPPPPDSGTFPASQPVAAPARIAATSPNPTAPSASGSTSAETATGSVQFLPLTGVPQAKAELLARALSQSAAARGLEIRPASEAKTKVRLKGYFSAFNDGSNTVLVYVWDVLDENDQRTSRIQGQETIPGTPADPWNSVDEASLDAVAAKTMDGARQALGLDG